MTCKRCDGTGMVMVSETHAREKAGPLEVPVDASPRHREAMEREHRQLVTSLMNSAYPCKDCAPAAFYRWVTGHHDPDHDAARCPDCATPTTKPTPRRRVTPDLPERRDLQ